MDDPTIDELKALQKRLDYGDFHICWIGKHQFVIAHTNKERVEGDLEKCDLHLWLSGREESPCPIGLYVVVPNPLYNGRPWDFLPEDEDVLAEIRDERGMIP